MKKLFIFEGPDGCGKSTQVELFANKLIALGKKVKITREPGGTEFGEVIRNILLHSKHDLSLETQAYLFAAARRHHNEQIIKWIEEGYIVICDRHLLSSLAYQSKGEYSTVGQEIRIDQIFRLNDLAMEPINDLIAQYNMFNDNFTDSCQILYFDINSDTISERANKRIDERGLDNIEKNYALESELEDLINRYKTAIKRLKRFDVVILDANKSIEEIHQDLIDLI